MSTAPQGDGVSFEHRERNHSISMASPRHIPHRAMFDGRLTTPVICQPRWSHQPRSHAATQATTQNSSCSLTAVQALRKIASKGTGVKPPLQGLVLVPAQNSQLCHGVPCAGVWIYCVLLVWMSSNFVVSRLNSRFAFQRFPARYASLVCKILGPHYTKQGSMTFFQHHSAP